MNMVDIYLDSDDRAPPSDIERLSLRPLKWLRFVICTVCGARGDLLQSHKWHCCQAMTLPQLMMLLARTSTGLMVRPVRVLSTASYHN